ncbi:MAG: hypothetical protein J0626_02430, partial [Rhodospirillaceae bacterium]|nr:hypothetical protein [Rhodospirillaceae bacterium]
IMERLIQASKLEIDLDTAIAMDQQEAYRLADVFLGKHPEQANPMPGWNEPGAIDFFVANATGMDDTKPEDRLAHLFSHLVEKAHESAHAADADPQDEDWADAVNDAVTMVSHLLIGITLPDEVADTNAFNEAVGNSKG